MEELPRATPFAPIAVSYFESFVAADSEAVVVGFVAVPGSFVHYLTVSCWQVRVSWQSCCSLDSSAWGTSPGPETVVVVWGREPCTSDQVELAVEVE